MAKLLPLVVLTALVAYTLVMRWLHFRQRTVHDPETCPSGGSHWWHGAYRYPPTSEPVEEECECCGATRVVAYENGFEEGTILGYERPQS